MCDKPQEVYFPKDLLFNICEALGMVQCKHSVNVFVVLNLRITFSFINPLIIKMADSTLRISANISMDRLCVINLKYNHYTEKCKFSENWSYFPFPQINFTWKLP